MDQRRPASPTTTPRASPSTKANLFSYNSFSGTDRQETGLRANLGLHYLANFSDGSYLDAVLGQSFHLAGANSLATADAVNAGAGAGLSGTSSDIVAGARIGMGDNDYASRPSPATTSRRRASPPPPPVSPTPISGWTVGLDYSYMAPDPARGYTDVQQDIGGSVGIPARRLLDAVRRGWAGTSPPAG